MSNPRVTLADGVVEGLSTNGVSRFFSIPYAAPPVGDHRFRAPQPAERWVGVRDATRSGPRAPQSFGPIPGLDVAAFMGSPSEPGDDYLTLNLWAADGKTGCPVMMFFHGGSLVCGSKDAPVYDGTAFARDGVVCITINYRLGIEGFLPIPGVPTNLGLRDAIAALAWVRDNVATFGGDPGNVTIFGESAGAAVVATLTLSPLAKGLFGRAICQSGHADLTRPIAKMQPFARKIAKWLRIAADRDGFASVTPERLLEAQKWVGKSSLFTDMRDEDGNDLSFGTARFIPVYGDDVLPLRPSEALRRGDGGDVQLLIGTTSEEANLFFVPGNGGDRIKKWHVWLMTRRAVPDGRRLRRAYGLGQPGITPGDVMTRIMGDLLFQAMSRRTAEMHRGQSWVYSFDWGSTALDGKLGAAHAVELPFVFDTLAAATGPEGLAGENPPQELADHVHALWAEFARNGALPWPQYDADTRQVYSLLKRKATHEPPTPAAAFLP